MKLLSILIPTIPEREPVLKRLLGELSYQITKGNYWDDVEILIDNDKKMFDGGKHTGKKRQELTEKAKAKYVLHVDDDDDLVREYMDVVIAALRKNPDVVTYAGWMTTNGEQRINWEIKCGNPYAAVDNIYKRPPNHIVPIKRDIALRVGYNVNLTAGEDYDYCMRLEASGMLRTEHEIHIPKYMYHYNYSTFNKTHP